MRYLFTFMCVLALGVVGCGETADTGVTGGDGGGGGGSAITPGLWLGGDPPSNTDGSPFDTGWAICFHVNEDGSALTMSGDCDVDGQDDDETWAIEVSWKDDVGRDPGDPDGEGCSATGTFVETVAIEDNAFEVFTDDFVHVVGSFDGETASGTAMFDFPSPGMGAPSEECELVVEWTASPAP